MAKFEVSALFKAIDNITGPTKKMRVGVKSLTASFDRLKSSAGTVTKRFGLVGAGAIAAGGAVVVFANKFAEAGDLAAKTADNIGLSVETFQELRFAADRSGVSANGFRSSMIKLTKTVGELKVGTGALTTFLDKSSPALKAQLEAASSTEEAFTILIDALGRIEDPMKRAALANAAFGRSGVEMVKLAKEGGDGLAALRAEARRLGIVIGEDTARQGEGFVDAMTDLKAATTGITNVIGAGLLPILQPLIKRLTELFVAIRPKVAAQAQKIFADLGNTLENINFEQVIASIQAGFNTFRKVIDFVGGWKNAAIGLGAVLAGPLLAAIGSLSLALTQIGITLLANPIGLAVAAIAAGAFLIIKNWTPIKEFFVGLWNDITGLFDSGLKTITDTINEITSLASKVSPQNLFKSASGAISDLFGFNNEATNQTATQTPALAQNRIREARLAQAQPVQNSATDVNITFNNLPQGAVVATQPVRGAANVNSNVGRRQIGAVQ